MVLLIVFLVVVLLVVLLLVLLVLLLVLLMLLLVVLLLVLLVVLLMLLLVVLLLVLLMVTESTATIITAVIGVTHVYILHSTPFSDVHIGMPHSHTRTRAHARAITHRYPLLHSCLLLLQTDAHACIQVGQSTPGSNSSSILQTPAHSTGELSDPTRSDDMATPSSTFWAGVAASKVPRVQHAKSSSSRDSPKRVNVSSSFWGEGSLSEAREVVLLLNDTPASSMGGITTFSYAREDQRQACGAKTGEEGGYQVEGLDKKEDVGRKEGAEWKEEGNMEEGEEVERKEQMRCLRVPQKPEVAGSIFSGVSELSSILSSSVDDAADWGTHGCSSFSQSHSASPLELFQAFEGTLV